MPPSKPQDNSDKLIADLIATNRTLVDTMQSVLAAQKEQGDRVYKFLFVGDPEKGVPPFVTETRDDIRSNTQWINGFRSTYLRIAWISIGVVVAGLTTAAFVWRFGALP